MSKTAHSTDTIAAAQLATLSTSAAHLARARAHVQRLDAHAAEIRNRLDALAGGEGAGPLRGEGVEVDRQRRQAAAVLADVEAEHARHEADLSAMYGAEGQARAALAEAHQVRDTAQTAATDAKAILGRASAHAAAVEGRLAAARADEARHDIEAADRLHAALRDGTEAPAAQPFSRASAGLEDDTRAARAAEARAASEHRAKLAALAEAERQVRGAVDTVLLADADAMAREVAALDARADLLRARLTAFTARTRGDYVAPEAPAPDLTRTAWSPPPPPILTMMPTAPRIASSPAIAAALVDRSFVQPAPRDTSRDVAAWTSYASALAGDVGAASSFSLDPAPEARPPFLGLPRFPASFDARPAA